MGQLKIRAGDIEIYIDVENDSFDEPLKIAIDALKQFSGAKLATISPASSSFIENDADGATLDVGINSVVAKLGGSSAREILRAAAVHLCLVDGLESFTRSALMARAHEARDWQAGYNTNQSRDLSRMVDQDELVEKTGGQYALPSKALAEARRALTNA